MKKLIVAIVAAGIATVAIASNCNTTCNTYGDRTICVTRCHDTNGNVKTCTETCQRYGDRVNCNTSCY